jgi:DNA-directed RNA polymerase specialized sigma24 family protein
MSSGAGSVRGLLPSDRCARADATDSEADLLRRIGAGDELAWHEVVRRYGKLVSATVRSFRLQEADARDAVQMTWLRLAENADRVQSPGRLGGWLVTTARRECLHILRQAKHGSNLIDGHGHVDEILPTANQRPSVGTATRGPAITRLSFTTTATGHGVDPGRLHASRDR